MPRRTEKQGVPIPWVTDSRGDRYDVSEIDRQPEPRYVAPLECGGCGTRVSALHGNADNPDSRTSHYFRIDPHTAACRCDLDQRGKQLARSLAAPPPAVSTGPPGEQLAPRGKPGVLARGASRVLVDPYRSALASSEVAVTAGIHHPRRSTG